MASWRCPHCSTPQPEASRCWVCHRSSTSRGTCRHFRQSVAARVGFCAVDRKHEPLRGDEVRACWEDGAVPILPEAPVPGLLDLLTERALSHEPETDDPALAVRLPRPMEPAAARLRSLTPARGRDWIEVEA